MAEVLGISTVAMALSFLDMSQGMYKSAAGVKNPSREIAELFDELHILDTVFSESMIKAKDFLKRTPASVAAALERCHARKSTLAKLLDRCLGEAQDSAGKKGPRQQLIRFKNHFKYVILSEEVGANRDFYRSAVLLLQSVVNDAVTHEMLRNMQPAAKKSDLNAADQFSKVLFALTGQSNNQEDRGPSDEALEQLSSILPQLTNDSSVPEVLQEQTNADQKECPTCKGPWLLENAVPDAYEVLALFNATICCVDQVNSYRGQQPTSPTPQPRSLWYPVRGIYDTGANGDLVALDVLQRAKLIEFIKPLDHVAVATVLEKRHEFHSTITLTWVLNHDLVSEERDFYVAPEADFDILLGNPYLKEHRYAKLVHNKSTVTKFSLRALFFNMHRDKQTKEREQSNKKAKDAEARQAVEAEEARQAAERDTLRQTSTASTTTTTPLLTATTSGVSRTNSTSSNVAPNRLSTVSISALPDPRSTSGWSTL